MPFPRPALWRLVGLLLIIATVALLATLTGVSDLERLRDLTGAGPVAPVVFVLIYATYTLAPLPRTALSILTGVLFGLWGVALAYVGSLLGAAMAFGLARVLGRQAVVGLTGSAGARADEILERRGFAAVLVSRVVPVIPFMVVNYTAGVTDIRPRAYWLATVIGIVPGTVFYVTVGAYAMEVESASTGLTLALLTVAGGTVVAYLAWRRHRRATDQQAVRVQHQRPPA